MLRPDNRDFVCLNHKLKRAHYVLSSESLIEAIEAVFGNIQGAQTLTLYGASFVSRVMNCATASLKCPR